MLGGTNVAIHAGVFEHPESPFSNTFEIYVFNAR